MAYVQIGDKIDNACSVTDSRSNSFRKRSDVTSNFVSAIFGKSKSAENGKSKSPVLEKKRPVLFKKFTKTESYVGTKKEDLYVV
jgi:hypothetical protein